MFILADYIIDSQKNNIFQDRYFEIYSINKAIKKNNEKEIKSILSMFHECKRCEIDRSRKVLLFKGKCSECSVQFYFIIEEF